VPDWVVARGQHGAAGVGDDTHAIGGRAGGYINLFSSRMVLAGNITARGGSGLTPGAGGGAGGVVLLDAFHAVEGGGVVDARGGDGGDSGIGSGSGGGGGGGGGRVTVRARGKEGGPEAAAAVWDTSDGQTQPPLRVLRNGGLGGESGTADSGGGCGSVGVFQVYHGSGKVDVPWVPWVSVAADTLVEGDSAKVCDYSNRNPAATPHVLGCYGLDAHVTVVGTPVRLDPSDAMCNTAVGERTTTVMAATLLSALHARSSSDAPMVNASVVAQQVTLGAGARAEVVVLAPHDASAPASYTSVMAADRVSVQEDAELVVTAGGALLTAWFHNKGTVHTTGADFGVDAAPFTTKDGRPPALIAASANMTHGEGSVVNASSSNLHLHGNTTVLFTAGVVRSATGLHVSAVGSVVWESCDVTGHGVVVEASSASAASGGAGIVLRDTTVRLTAPGNWTAAGLELTHSLIEVAPGLFSTPATSLGRRLASSSSSSSSDSNGTCHWSFTHDGVVLRVGQKDGVSSELRVINGMSLVLADTSLVAETDAMVSLRNGAHLAARAIRVSGSLHVGDDDTAAPSEVVLSATGSLRFLDGSTTAVNATAVFQADGILVAGAVVGGHSARFEAYSALTISSSGSLQLHARHCVLTTAKGTIAINGMASLGAHAIISAPALTVVGSLALASSGKVNIRGDVVVEGSLTFASSGAVMSTGGDVTVNDGGSLMMESDGGITSYRAGFFGGGITLLGDVSLGSRGTLFTAGGDVSVKDSGVLVMGADGNMTSSRVSSSSLGGGIDVVGSVSLSSGGTVASLTGVKVWNSGSLSLGSGGLVTSSDGGLEVAGHMSLAPDGAVSTTGGGISVLSDGTLTMELDGHVMSLVSGSIGGTINVGGNMSLAAGGSVEAAGGDITVLESGVVSMQSAGTVWCDGHILVEGTVLLSSQGAVTASGGDVSVMQNGTLTLDSDGVVAAHRRGFFGGGITLLGDMSLGSRGTLLTAGGAVAVKDSGVLVMGVDGNMTSSRLPSSSKGGGIDIEGSASLSSGGTVASLTGVKVWNSGSLSLGSGGRVISSDGGLEVAGHISLAPDGVVSTTGGGISVLSDGTLTMELDGHVMSLVSGSIGGTIDVSGNMSLAAGGRVETTGGNITVLESGIVSMQSAGTVWCDGHILVEGTVFMSSQGAVRASGGDISVMQNGTLTLDSDGAVAAHRRSFFGGGITLLGGMSLGPRGTLLTAGGDVAVKSSGILVMGVHGNMTSFRAPSASTGGGIDVEGSVSLATAGTVASLSGVKVWRQGRLSLGSRGHVTSSDGGLEVLGHMSVASAGTVSTTGGSISVLSDAMFALGEDGHVMSHVSGSVGGTIDVDGRMSLAAGGRVEATGGNVTVLESGVVSMQSAGTVWCDGHVAIEGTMSLSSQGAVTASGGDVSVMQNGSLTLDSDGVVAAHRRGFFGGGITLFGNMSLGSRGTLLTAGGDVAVKAGGALVMEVDGNVTSSLVPSSSKGGGIGIEGSVSLSAGGTVASLRGVKVWRQGRLSLGSRGHVTSSDGGLEVVGHMSVASNGTVSTTGGGIVVAKGGMLVLDEAGVVVVEYDGTGMQVVGTMSLGINGTVRMREGASAVVEGHTSLLSLASGSSMELVGSDDGGNSAGGLTVCDGGTLALATHVSILADALQLCQLGRITPLLAPSSVHAMPTSPAAHTGTATTVAVRVSTFTLGPNTTAVFVPGAAIVAAEAITLQPGATLSALSHVRAVACPGVTALNGQCTAAVARAGGSHASLGGGEPTLVVTNHTRTVPVDLATVSTPTPSSLQAPFSLSEAEVVARDATAWTLGGAAQANETEWDTVSQAAATTASSSSSWDTVYPLPPGTGGGVLRVVAPSVQVDTGSAIHVDGRGGAHVPSLLASGGVPPTSITAPGDWGGGAGGTVVVVCAHLVGDGRVSANGGNGGGWGGGGAGGHVVVRAGNMTAWDSEAQARAGASELCVFLFFVAFLFVWALLSFVVSHVRCRWFVRLLSCLVLSCFVGRDGVNVGCGAVT